MFTIVESDWPDHGWDVFFSTGRWLSHDLVFDAAVAYIVWLYDHNYLPPVPGRREKRMP